MKKMFLFLVLLGFLSIACSVSGMPSIGGDTVTAPTAQLPPPAAIDPRPLDTAGMEECSVIDDSSLTSVLHAAPIDRAPNAEMGSVGCYYTFEGGKTFSLTINVDTPGRKVYDGVMQYLEVSQGAEPVPVGDIAVIKEVNGQVSFDAVFNGWYVSMRGDGFPRESYITIAQWLTARFIPFPPEAVAEQPTAASSGVLPGSLIDMQVTIESPAEVAGVTTLAELNASGFIGFATCSTPSSVPFIVNFIASPVSQPPTPVSVFSITAEAGVTPGQPSPAVISIGTGPSDNAQTNVWQGAIVVAADGLSGTFEVPGQVKGSWTCAFAP